MSYNRWTRTCSRPSCWTHGTRPSGTPRRYEEAALSVHIFIWQLSTTNGWCHVVVTPSFLPVRWSTQEICATYSVPYYKTRPVEGEIPPWERPSALPAPEKSDEPLETEEGADDFKKEDGGKEEAAEGEAAGEGGEKGQEAQEEAAEEEDEEERKRKEAAAAAAAE